MSYMAHVGGPSGLEGPPSPYAATKLDLQLATAPLSEEAGEDRFNPGIGMCMLLGTVDFPLTALLDTALLPLDLTKTIQARKAGIPTSELTPDE